jgi:hypothetical protein
MADTDSSEASCGRLLTKSFFIRVPDVALKEKTPHKAGL